MTRITEGALKTLLRSNPDLGCAESAVRKRPAIPVESDKDRLTAEFERLWRVLGGQELTTELRFHPVRGWRFDYAHVASKTAIEINGGVWSGGRHVRGAGYLRDREKVNAAQLMGWRVIELGTGQVTPATLAPIIEAIQQCAEVT